MKKKLGLTYGIITNQGGRKINEDSVGSFNNRIFVLCDGLGGHGNGDVASQLVVEQMLSCYSNQNMSVEEGVVFSQEALLLRQRELNIKNSMKTTLTCLEISNNLAKIVYIGDSRVYLFENNKYKFRTLDHSVPQMLVQRGAIKEKDIRHHEDRSRLLRVMGAEWDSPKYQVVDGIKLTDRTTFLLCSDGFWELIDEKMMSKTLKKSKTPQEWLSAMEKIVLMKGKGTNMDNYSAIAVFIR